MKNVEPDPAIVEAAAASHGEAMKALAATLTELPASATTRGGPHRGLRHARLAAPRPAAERRRRPLLRLGPGVRAADLARGAADAAAGLGVLSVREQPRHGQGDGQARPRRPSSARPPAWPIPAERLRDCDTLEGAEYALDLSKPAGQRVVSLRRGGREIADDDVFTVALNSYRASGGGGYPMWKRAERVREKGNVREMLAADARSAKRLDLTPTKNWSATR